MHSCPHVLLPAALLALSAGSLGCQLLFGLDDYELAQACTPVKPAPPPAQACDPPARDITPGDGVCGVRRLDGLSTPKPETSPGASCTGTACDIYFQRSNPGNILCGTCTDIASGVCGDMTAIPGIPGTGRDPYPRKGQPELWLSFVQPNDDDYDVGFATITGPCAVGAFTAANPQALDDNAVSSPNHEFYPAISPNGKTLFFTRCEAPNQTYGACRIHVAHRDMASGPFMAEMRVPGLHDGAPDQSMDMEARPVWADDQDAVEVLYFSSTRAAPSPTAQPAELDLFVARRPPGSAWNAPFEPAEPVRALTSPEADVTPLPLNDTAWLWSRGLGSENTDLYVVDIGCGTRFTPLDPGPFVNVNTQRDERSPVLAGGGALLLSRDSEDDGTALLQASRAEGDDAWGRASSLACPPIGRRDGVRDTDPFVLGDGSVLFASDREEPGLYKLWIAAPDGSPARVTSEPSFFEMAPFVDESDGALWLSWGGGSDPAGVIARAQSDGNGGWRTPVEVELAHEVGRADTAPRLSADGATLFFVSARSGGFAPAANLVGAPSVPTVWVATRANADDAWGLPFPLPELSTVNGVVDPWLSPDGCSVAVAAKGRETSFSWDLMSAVINTAPQGVAP